METKKLTKKPHTLKVNELPKHTHEMIGYSYNSSNTAYYTFGTWNYNGGLVMSYYNGVDYHFHDVDRYQGDSIKRYRGFSLGDENGYDTGVAGNNESKSIICQ